MAIQTYGNHVKPELFFVTFVVVVMFGLATALAFLGRDFRQVTRLDGMSYSQSSVEFISVACSTVSIFYLAPSLAFVAGLIFTHCPFSGLITRFAFFVGLFGGLPFIAVVISFIGLFLAISACSLQAIGITAILIKFARVYPILARTALFHTLLQNKERPWLMLPVLSRTKQSQRRSRIMIAKYSFSGNYLMRDVNIIAQRS